MMNAPEKIKRFDFVSEYNPTACQDQVKAVEDADGSYVLFKDYEQLQQENAELKARVDTLKELHSQSYAVGKDICREKQKLQAQLQQRVPDPLNQVIDVQCSDGNWNHNPYMHGMANGLLLAKACIEDKPPEYLSAPDSWIAAPQPTEPGQWIFTTNPTREDADGFNEIYIFDIENDEVVKDFWFNYENRKYFRAWMRTGIQRPAAPQEQREGE